MIVQKLTETLQTYCHEGGSLDEVVIYNKEGKKLCAIESVDILRPLDGSNEVCRIVVHPKNDFDEEQYLEELKAERLKVDNCVDRALFGLLKKSSNEIKW